MQSTEASLQGGAGQRGDSGPGHMETNPCKNVSRGQMGAAQGQVSRGRVAQWRG